MERFLAIYAHPDDESFGFAGTAMPFFYGMLRRRGPREFFHLAIDRERRGGSGDVHE